MDDSQLAKVGQGRNQLLEKLAGFLFFQTVLRSDEAEKLAIAAVLHNQEQPVWSLNRLIKLDDMRMAHHFQDVNLTRDSLNIVNISYLALVENLDGDLMSKESRKEVSMSQNKQ